MQDDLWVNVIWIGQPTNMMLVGPFETEEAAKQWSEGEEGHIILKLHNPALISGTTE